MEEEKRTREDIRISRGMAWITNAIFKERERGYHGICLDMDDLHKKRNGCSRVLPYTDAEIEQVIYWVKELNMFRNIKYYGSQTYLPSGCELYHNIKGAWVGRLLSIDCDF